jgi:hypothetical protein
VLQVLLQGRRLHIAASLPDAAVLQRELASQSPAKGLRVLRGQVKHLGEPPDRLGVGRVSGLHDRHSGQ